MIRLGVIVSLLWFFGWAGYAWFGEVLELEEQYGNYLKDCSTILDDGEDQIVYEYCVDDATEFYFSRFGDYQEQIPSLLALDFGAVFIGWIIPLLGMPLIRGVKWTLFSLMRHDKEFMAPAPSMIGSRGELLDGENRLPWAPPSASSRSLKWDLLEPAAQLQYLTPRNASPAHFNAVRSAIPVLRPSRTCIREAPPFPTRVLPFGLWNIVQHPKGIVAPRAPSEKPLDHLGPN